MNSIWNTVIAQLKDNSSRGPRAALLRSAKLASHQDGDSQVNLRVKLGSSFEALMFERHLLKDLTEKLEHHCGKRVAVDFDIESKQEGFLALATEDGESAEKPAEAAEARFFFRNRLELNSEFTLSTFIETPENSFGIRASEELSTTSSLSILSFHGPAGVGKTHLLHATGWELKKAFPHARLRVVTGDDFITDFQTAVTKRTMGDFRRRYRLETDILLIDDLHSLSRAKATQEELFNLINHMSSTGRKLVVTSDRDFEALTDLEERVRSRLLGGLVIQLSYPSRSSRIRILKTKLMAEGMDLGADLLELLEKSSGLCLRSLDGSINKLKLLKRTGRLTREAILGLFPQSLENPAGKDPESIMATVAAKHGIKISDLRGRGRTRSLVIARRESMKLMREELNLSLAEIGRLHMRDHTTVLCALRET